MALVILEGHAVGAQREEWKAKGDKPGGSRFTLHISQGFQEGVAFVMIPLEWSGVASQIEMGEALRLRCRSRVTPWVKSPDGVEWHLVEILDHSGEPLNAAAAAAAGNGHS
jgi:hypothetical protein